MYNITAYLTIKNKTFYTVLTYYVDGIRKMKWISTGFKENESKKKAEKKLIQIRDEFKNKLETITTIKTEDKKQPQDFLWLFLCPYSQTVKRIANIRVTIERKKYE